jgi:hypothetical protein
VGRGDRGMCSTTRAAFPAQGDTNQVCLETGHECCDASISNNCNTRQALMSTLAPMET